jgi:ABC-type transport system substrate-binding protein
MMEGPGWQDWAGVHVSLPDNRRRIRRYTLAAAASKDQRDMLIRAAKREYQVLDNLSHRGILAVKGFTDNEYGPALIFEHHPKAVRLDHYLADAGAKNLSLTLTIPSAYGTTVPQILVSNLRDVGITLKVNPVEFPTWIKDVYTNKDYELSFVLHTEAHDFENWANPDYYFTYDNPEVQQLYAQSVASTDDAEAAELLKKAARLVSEDDAADWLYNGQSVLAVASNVSGMPTVNVNERVNVAELAKSEG